MGKEPNAYRSGAYADHNPDWHDADAPAKADGLAPWLQRIPCVPSRVLDVGCGTGGVLSALKPRFDACWPDTEWEGWDIAPEAIRRAEAYRAPRLRFVCGDVFETPVTADVCLAIDVVEHLVDDEAFLAALAPRAPWHLLRIPLELSVLDVIRPARLLAARERWGHRHAYTRDLALAKLVRAGLNIVGTATHRVPVVPTSLPGRLFRPFRRSFERWAPKTAATILGGVSLVVLARR
ncbi:MAG: class I SAM-dependent methyltransferase [Myxococcota bacterium]